MKSDNCLPRLHEILINIICSIHKRLLYFEERSEEINFILIEIKRQELICPKIEPRLKSDAFALSFLNFTGQNKVFAYFKEETKKSALYKELTIKALKLRLT